MLPSPKKHLVVLSASYAHIDPRILWMADSFLKEYDVTILAYDSRHERRDQQEVFFSYEDIYLKHRVITCGTSKKTFKEKTKSFVLALKFCGKKSKHKNSSALSKLIISQLDRIKPAPSPGFIDRVKAKISNYPSIASKLKKLQRLFSNENSAVIVITPKTLPPQNISPLILLHFANAHDSLVYEISKIKKPIDVIYAADLDSLLCAVSFKLKNPRTYKLIYDAHEIYWASRGENDKEFQETMRQYEKTLMPFVDRFITVSPMILELYQNEYLFIKEKSLCVPNASPLFNFANEPLRKNAPMVFLFQGGITPERGLDFFIRAWLKVEKKGAILIIRGPSAFGEINRLQEIAGNALNQSIFFKESVPEHDLISSAREADIGIIPYPPTTLNQKYCCPNKLSQYMQAGLAILAADTEFVSSILLDSNAGVTYDPFNIDDLVKKLGYLINNSTSVKTHQSEAKKYAETQFNWQTYESDLLSFIS